GGWGGGGGGGSGGGPGGGGSAAGGGGYGLPPAWWLRSMFERGRTAEPPRARADGSRSRRRQRPGARRWEKERDEDEGRHPPGTPAGLGGSRAGARSTQGQRGPHPVRGCGSLPLGRAP